MTTEIGNSALLRTWANDGTVAVPSNAKIDEGWLRGEQPPHEWMNYIHNVLGQKVNHALSRGVADWVATTEYTAGALVNRSGDAWLCLVTNTASEPDDANSNWVRLARGGTAPTAPTPPAGDDSTRIATTAYVQDELPALGTAEGEVPVLVAGGLLPPSTLGATGSLPVVPVRAFGKISMTGEIVFSVGVASVAKTGTGTYTVTLSSAMAGENWSVVANATSGAIVVVADAVSSTQFNLLLTNVISHVAQDRGFNFIVVGNG